MMNMSTQTTRTAMGCKKYSVHHHHPKFEQLPIVFFLFFVSSIIFILTLSTYKPKLGGSTDHHHHQVQVSDISPNVNKVGRQINKKRAEWLDAVVEELGIKKRIRLGLLNMEEEGFVLKEEQGHDDDTASSSGGSSLETVGIKFDKIRDDLRWEELYPEWIDEEVKFGVPPSCPDIPLAVVEEKLDVLVARAPCGVRDVFRLQVNLAVADLAVRNGDELNDRAVLVVFIGECGPMLEVFNCDDLLREGDGFWIYKPNLNKLQQKVKMPFGSCQLAQGEIQQATASTVQKPREAYATLLHSSEAYVCGAIALAQSIKRTNSTKDLILLADASLTPHSMRGLRAAGWKIKAIKRIRSPYADKGAYNEWNYSKLRLWQLTQYDKVIFIDSDLVVIRNIDHFFHHPQLSAAGNDGTLFNSGVMLIEPSDCMFKTLMNKTPDIVPYNGGDQGFLNEVFTWWHRWPAKINALKNFADKDKLRQVPDNTFAIHYLGLKPWMCYRDYDCNWDMETHHVFASDAAHVRWWEIYNTMSDDLRPYCALTTKMDERIRKWREIARRARLANGHWSIKPTDPRQNNSY